MGKFSKPRGTSSPDPDKDLNPEFDPEMELNEQDFAPYEYAAGNPDPFETQYLAPRRKRTGLLIALCISVLLFLGCAAGYLFLTPGSGFGAGNVMLENVFICIPYEIGRAHV